MTVQELLLNINAEDQKIAAVVKQAIPQIEMLVQVIVDKMLAGGRLFYIGAGTSGRLAIVDASECVPTFGISPGIVTGIIAGGNAAITQPVEFAEDNAGQGWIDLLAFNVGDPDIVIGLSAGGTAPYVIGALQQCRENNIITGGISCNPGSPLSDIATICVEIVTGPEFVTGSTRMKAGTAQKMVLNMISTSVMIKLGTIEDNKMVNMQLTNEKLIDRGVKIIMERTGSHDYTEARELLMRFGSVKTALKNI